MIFSSPPTRLSIKFSFGLLLLSAVASIKVNAESIENSGVINISPRSCLITKNHNHCERSLIISWNFETATDFCVLLKNGVQLFCEYSQLAGKREIDGDLRVTTTFVFQKPETKNYFAKVVVYVLKKSQPTLRKRYSHPWSIF